MQADLPLFTGKRGRVERMIYALGDQPFTVLQLSEALADAKGHRASRYTIHDAIRRMREAGRVVVADEDHRNTYRCIKRPKWPTINVTTKQAAVEKFFDQYLRGGLVMCTEAHLRGLLNAVVNE